MGDGGMEGQINGKMHRQMNKMPLCRFLRDSGYISIEGGFPVLHSKAKWRATHWNRNPSPLLGLLPKKKKRETERGEIVPKEKMHGGQNCEKRE